MNQNVPRFDKSGFSLVETVIATLVVGIGIAGVTGLVFWMVRANGWGGNMTTALTLGQDRLEGFRTTSYGQITDGSDTVGPFMRTWTITNNTSNRHKIVELEVGWIRPNDAVSKVVMQSLTSNPAVPGVDLSPFGIDTSGGGGG